MTMEMRVRWLRRLPALLVVFTLGLQCQAVLAQMRVRAWGDDGLGELGDGRPLRYLQPVQTVSQITLRAISSGDAHTLAIKSDGTVWAWGDNSSGELGDGTTIGRSAPAQVSGLVNI